MAYVPLRRAAAGPLRTRCLGPVHDPARDADHRVEVDSVAALDAALHARDSDADRPLTPGS